MSSRIRIVWIVVSLAALAIVLSPVSPFPLSQNVSAPRGDPDEEPIDETAIAPLEIGDEDFETCNSISDNVEAILVEADESRMNATRKTASDLLLGEYCNRPALVHEINATGNPGLSLVAYACDAGSGKLGDTQLKESLLDHRVIYCESSAFSIQEEAEALRIAADGFREDFVIALKEDNSSATNVERAAELEASVDKIISTLDAAESLVTAGDHYGGAKMLDTASNSFEALLERAEESE